MQPLPIDPLLPEILATLARERRLVLEAPPGAGKTTRVPAGLLALPELQGEIWVAEPRRLAARLVAERVASERGEALGATVGYSVRFEEVGGPQTRLRFLTSGLLLRRLVADPRLPGVSCVMLDEFHERHLDTDLCLALLVRAQATVRPDLRLIVTSATLDGERIAARLGNAPRLVSEGRMFPLAIEHLAQPDDRPLEKQVSSAVRSLLNDGPEGDLLVFLPGAAELRRAEAQLKELAAQHGVALHLLHGELPLEQQTAALAPSQRRKIVLCTNVAESSVTVPGVTGVVDAGLARIATCSPHSGFSRLQTAPISRASATQRAGRAGRTAPGRVLRLYTRSDFLTRAEHETPELLRMDLSEARLLLSGAGVQSLDELTFIDSPPEKAQRAAENLLLQLRAIDAQLQLTPLGRRMLRFPLHPRLARLVTEAEQRGIAPLGASAAALLSERDLRSETRFRGGGQPSGPAGARGSSDLLELVERLDEAKQARFDSRRLAQLQVDPRTARVVAQAERQLTRLSRNAAPCPASLAQQEQELAYCVLAAFPDRIGRRRNFGEPELVMTSGSAAKLASSSVVLDAEWLVALDIEDGPTGRSGAALVRLASEIKPDWLFELAPDSIVAEDDYEWSDARERVERWSRMRIGSVLLDESRAIAPPGPETAKVLARIVEARGWQHDATLTSLQERLALLAAQGLLETDATGLTSHALALLGPLLATRSDLRGLEAASLAEQALASLPGSTLSLLREMTPDRLTLPGGKGCPIHYEAGLPPWIESRLQDFFGMSRTPAICGGRVPLTVHLLAPNHRAVQVTRDLAGFWERHYPTIRKELMRRYPRHPWPEEGQTAEPPPPRPPRRPKK